MESHPASTYYACCKYHESPFTYLVNEYLSASQFIDCINEQMNDPPYYHVTHVPWSNPGNQPVVRNTALEVIESLVTHPLAYICSPHSCFYHSKNILRLFFLQYCYMKMNNKQCISPGISFLTFFSYISYPKERKIWPMRCVIYKHIAHYLHVWVLEELRDKWHV